MEAVSGDVSPRIGSVVASRQCRRALVMPLNRRSGVSAFLKVGLNFWERVHSKLTHEH